MSLYNDIGGDAAVNAAVELFYTKVLADDSVNGFLMASDVASKGNDEAFLTFAFGGSASYSGRNMRIAHRRQVAQGLNEQHFDAIIRHLGATLKELGVASDKIKEAAAIAVSVKDDVLNR